MGNDKELQNAWRGRHHVPPGEADMRTWTLLFLACGIATLFVPNGETQGRAPEHAGPFAIASATVTIDGTSNRGAYLARTRTVRVTRATLSGPPSADILDHVLEPGGLEAFDVTIPVMTLSSPDAGVDQHLREALRAEDYPEIRFRLHRVKGGGRDTVGGISPLRADGTLTIAGVDRAVTLDIKTTRAGSYLMVDATTDLLMTDFGVQPPNGFLGVLKTNPAIRVRCYLVLTPAQE